MTMLEKATRAAQAEARKWSGRDLLNATEITRAVLAAIREPDEAMWNAAQRQLAAGEGATDIWQAMLDAITEE